MLDRYSCTIEYSEEDQVFIARSFEFPYVSAFGNTRVEAAEEFEVALWLVIASYLDSPEQLQLPEPKLLKRESI